MHRGILRAYDAGTKTANVELHDLGATFLAAVRVSRGIADAEMITGRTVVVVLFNPEDPKDGMVIGIY